MTTAISNISQTIIIQINFTNYIINFYIILDKENFVFIFIFFKCLIKNFVPVLLVSQNKDFYFFSNKKLINFKIFFFGRSKIIIYIFYLITIIKSFFNKKHIYLLESLSLKYFKFLN